MKTAVTQGQLDSKPAEVLYMAFELGRKKWKLGFTTGLGQKARQRNVRGGDMAAVLAEIERARQRFGVSVAGRVVSCYEAGPDGFWLHRYLLAHGIENVVVDSASIEVSRRKRRAKSDGLDVQALLTLLIRHTMGQKRVWSVVRIPSPEIEDARQVHREIERLEVVGRQIRTLGQTLRAELRSAATAGTPAAMMQRLVELRSISPQGARVLALELFGWRQQRRIGIVALARKLMIALWRYAESGVVPARACSRQAGFQMERVSASGLRR